MPSRLENQKLENQKPETRNQNRKARDRHQGRSARDQGRSAPFWFLISSLLLLVSGPTLMMFKEGKLVDRAVDLMPRGELQKFIERNL
jgi:hypothetical protein